MIEITERDFDKEVLECELPVFACKVEETDSTGFQCYEESGEKMYRIWVKEENGIEE